MSSTISFFYVTFPSLQSAKKISRQLLKERLIACANLYPDMNSVFAWKGKIQTAKECGALLKTSKNKHKKMITRLEQLHPYEIPCIAEMDVKKLNSSYHQWLMSCLKP